MARTSQPLDIEQARVLREARGKTGLTQEEVARRIGASTRTIGRIESGEGGLSLDRYRRLVEALGASELPRQPMSFFCSHCGRKNLVEAAHG